MADWKQITARIRRARTGKDPAAQLSNLYEKTQDAMVAFELARHFETASQNAEAAKWYTTAAARFRRADWKTKAQEAAVRLGGQAPLESPSDLPAVSPSRHDFSADQWWPDSPLARTAGRNSGDLIFHKQPGRRDRGSGQWFCTDSSRWSSRHNTDSRINERRFSVIGLVNGSETDGTRTDSSGRNSVVGES